MPMIPISDSILVGALPALILLGSLIAHLKRRRRIAQFGDETVLGLSRCWYRSIVTPILTSTAAGCIAAALIVPAVGLKTEEGGAELGIVIDGQFAKVGLGTDGAVDASDAVRMVISQSPARRLSVFLSGGSPTLLVPPTADAQGALAIMEGSASAAQWTVSRLDPGADRVVYVTSQQPDDVENAAKDIRSRSREVAYVVATGSGALLFGTYDRRGALSWSASPLALHEFLASEKPAETGAWSWLRSLRAVQRLAVTAFAFLVALCLWSRFRP